MQIKDFFKLTVIYLIWNAIRSGIKYHSDLYKIGKSLYSEELNFILSNYLNVSRLKRDWVGRLYCIVNPTMGRDGKRDMTKFIYELSPDGESYTLDSYIEQWLYMKLAAVQDLFKKRALFSYLDFSIRKVGPPASENYLFTVSLDSFQTWITSLKRLLVRLLFLFIAVFAVTTIINFKH